MIASTLAYAAIKKKIVARELKPGEKVSQLKISKELGISTVPIMEAMRLLESGGLLVKEGRKMARVRKLSLKEVEGVYLVREGLESIAARVCAQKISRQQLIKLRKLVEEFEAAVDYDNQDATSRLDAGIHKQIAVNADCPLLLEELDRMFLIDITAAQKRKVKDVNKYRCSHRAIVEAIADGDGDSAEYLMKKHIRDGYLEVAEQWQ